MYARGLSCKKSGRTALMLELVRWRVAQWTVSAAGQEGSPTRASHGWPLDQTSELHKELDHEV